MCIPTVKKGYCLPDIGCQMQIYFTPFDGCGPREALVWCLGRRYDVDWLQVLTSWWPYFGFALIYRQVGGWVLWRRSDRKPMRLVFMLS